MMNIILIQPKSIELMIFELIIRTTHYGVMNCYLALQLDFFFETLSGHYNHIIIVSLMT